MEYIEFIKLYHNFGTSGYFEDYFINFYPSTIIILYQLAWEPSAAQVTKSYSRHLPALEQFYRESKFSLFKSTHLI